MSEGFDVPISNMVMFDNGSDEEYEESLTDSVGPRKNIIHGNNHEYKDMIYDFAFVVQDYCRDHCLPIFNIPNTTNIIIRTLI